MRQYKDLEVILTQLFDEQEMYDDQRCDDYWSYLDDVYNKVKNMEEE